MGLDLMNERGHLCCLVRVRATYVILLRERQIVFVIIAVKSNMAYLRSICLDGDAQSIQCHFGKGATYAAREGFACRGTSSAAVVTHAIFGLIGEIGMGRAKHLTQILIVGRL